MSDIPNKHTEHHIEVYHRKLYLTAKTDSPSLRLISATIQMIIETKGVILLVMVGIPLSGNTYLPVALFVYCAGECHHTEMKANDTKRPLHVTNGTQRHWMVIIHTRSLKAKIICWKTKHKLIYGIPGVFKLLPNLIILYLNIVRAWMLMQWCLVSLRHHQRWGVTKMRSFFIYNREIFQ